MSWIVIAILFGAWIIASAIQRTHEEREMTEWRVRNKDYIEMQRYHRDDNCGGPGCAFCEMPIPD